MAHENLLPSLERFTVILSRLRGFSKFLVSNVNFGLSTQDLDNMLDTVNCLQLVAHRILITAGTELRQFQAFSGWLRHEIDTQTTDASSVESTEKDTNIDHASALEYIQGPMMHSRLIDFLNLEEQEEQPLQWNLAAEGSSLLELYKREHHNAIKGNVSGKRLSGLGKLIAHLESQSETVFNRIAETQRRNVRFGAPVSLGQGIFLCMDMRTVVEVMTPIAILDGPVETHAYHQEVHTENVVTYLALGSRAKHAAGEMLQTKVSWTCAQTNPSTHLPSFCPGRKRYELYETCRACHHPNSWL